MAAKVGATFAGVSWLRALAAAPHGFDFHQALRRIEVAFGELPRLGEALKPRDEPLRLGQDPSFDFVPSALRTFTPAADEGPPRLTVGFLGLFGPMGPLPLHLTEYARDRIRQAGDHTFAAFVDLFHHRMLELFHRAWSRSRATVNRDRPEHDRFRTYVGATCGHALPAQSQVDPIDDRAKLYFAGLFGMGSRPPDGLRAILAGYFGLPTQIREFVGEWLEIHEDDRFSLGSGPEVSSLGRTTVLGRRVFSRTHKFRVVLGPLASEDFVRFLPGRAELTRLSALVRSYAGSELAWDLELIPAPDAVTPLALGRAGRLGLGAALGRAQAGAARVNVVVDPFANSTERTAV